MPVEFEDGSKLATDDWFQILEAVKERAKRGKPKPVAITQSNVTVNVRGYEPNPNAPKQGQPAHENYVEANHKGWKIRVWRKAEERKGDPQFYGVNYFKGEDLRYIEIPFGDVRDENGVFKYVMSLLDDEYD